MNAIRHTHNLTIGEAARRLEKAGVKEPRLDAEIIYLHAAGITREKLIVSGNDELSQFDTENILAAFRPMLEQREKFVPVAYITGEREFWSIPIKVGPGVLVPRPDTELLVEITLKNFPKTFSGKILDFGTGSGCITAAISAELTSARIVAVDASPEALHYAELNTSAGRINGKISIMRASSIQELALGEGNGKFDAVISNPPYIPSADIESLAPDVRLYEPRTALDGGADGLDCIRQIISFAPELLVPGGLLALEFGFGQERDVDRLLGSAGYFRDTEFHRDIAGIVRAVSARLKG